MTITLPKKTVTLYARATAELKRQYCNAPSTTALILFSLERRDVKTIVDEVTGWNELSGCLRPLKRTQKKLP